MNLHSLAVYVSLSVPTPPNTGIRAMPIFSYHSYPAVDLLHVVLRARPELYAVDLAAQADDRAADLVALVEVLADERHREPRPAAVEQLRVVLHREHPLAAVRVRLVLPHRLDAGLEEVVVGVALALGGRLEPVEVPAEGLDGVELADHRQACLVLVRLGRLVVRDGGRVRWVALLRGRCCGREGHLVLGVVVDRP